MCMCSTAINANRNEGWEKLNPRELLSCNRSISFPQAVKWSSREPLCCRRLTRCIKVWWCSDEAPQGPWQRLVICRAGARLSLSSGVPVSTARCGAGPAVPAGQGRPCRRQGRRCWRGRAGGAGGAGWPCGRQGRRCWRGRAGRVGRWSPSFSGTAPTWRENGGGSVFLLNCYRARDAQVQQRSIFTVFAVERPFQVFGR